MIEIIEGQPGDGSIAQLVQNLQGKIRQYDQWTLEEIVLLLQGCATILENNNVPSGDLDQWLDILQRLTSAYENKDVVLIADIIENEFEIINP